MLDFPNSPTSNQVYQNYQWDGAKWIPYPSISQIALEAYLSANQTGMATNTWQTVKFNSKVTDVQNALNTSTGVFTPTIAGLYAVTATVNVNQAASAGVGIVIAKNGSAANPESQGYFLAAGINTAGIPQTCSALIYCNGTTDTISVSAFTGAAGIFYASGNISSYPSTTIVAVLQQIGPQGPQGIQGPAGGNTYQLSTFTSAGTFTTDPTSTTSTVYRVRMVAGGGGGGASLVSGAATGAGGGGAGEYRELIVTGRPAADAWSISPGAAGAAGTIGSNNAASGGTTSVTIAGQAITTLGGGGGTAASSSATLQPGGIGGSGGAAPAISGVTYLLDIAGQHGSPSSSTPIGMGGSGPLGSGQRYQGGAGSLVASGYGAGGGGAWNINTAGGAGSPGIVIIERMAG